MLEHIHIRGLVKNKRGAVPSCFPAKLAAWIEDRQSHKMLSVSVDCPSPVTPVDWEEADTWKDMKQGPYVWLEVPILPNMLFLTTQAELRGCCCAEVVAMSPPLWER